jgi:predicted nucleotidyltransferase
MITASIYQIQLVAQGLGKLKDKVAFVGGATAGLYVTDSAAPEPRPTEDVDCIIEIYSRIDYHQLEEQLRSQGFSNDTSADAPICRWKYQGVTVDIMPTDEKILGFSNVWYREGIRQAMNYILPNGQTIWIFRPPYFLASKLEAFLSRGNNEFRWSHDFEDLVYLLDNRPELINEIKEADTKLIRYIQKHFMAFQENPMLEEGISCVLPYGSGEERVEYIIKLMDNILKINN